MPAERQALSAALIDSLKEHLAYRCRRRHCPYQRRMPRLHRRQPVRGCSGQLRVPAEPVRQCAVRSGPRVRCRDVDGSSTWKPRADRREIQVGERMRRQRATGRTTRPRHVRVLVAVADRSRINREPAESPEQPEKTGDPRRSHAAVRNLTTFHDSSSTPRLTQRMERAPLDSLPAALCREGRSNFAD